MSDPIPRAQPPPQRAEHPDRWWRWRNNPLRRRNDLFQAWVGLLLAVAVGVATPLTGWAVGASVHGSLSATAEQQARTGRHLTAVLVHDAPRHPEPGSAEARETRYPAEVAYTAPDGTGRTATADVVPGLAAGAGVRVWVDGDGDIADPPAGPEDIRYRAIGWGSAAGCTVLATGKLAYAVTAHLLDRRRSAAWSDAWHRAADR
ncbi:Rv1733c family protein [Streptomyces johnsoniae]|uniref:Uncharacterized protein n=1 Tax=Streptomyces johnsoniae TaxID=3075532 RepID=A0ABU2RXA5_9ACTN|nr:hypothetical protein [Streptomyces sp. DSM 41886]MDT0441384.1 hypothetical protein [Streptomyces sp. DSM 41886]